jgi:hypothetical protein
MAKLKNEINILKKTDEMDTLKNNNGEKSDSNNFDAEIVKLCCRTYDEINGCGYKKRELPPGMKASLNFVLFLIRLSWQNLHKKYTLTKKRILKTT